MTSDIVHLRESVSRLNPRATHHQNGQQPSQDDVFQRALSPPIALAERSIMAPLIPEYNHQIDEMTLQLQQYQRQVTELKVKLETVVRENDRLHAELRESIEKELQSLPVGAMDDDDDDDDEGMADKGIVKNLQEQIQLSQLEKEQAMDLWQSAVQELERLQQRYQKAAADSHLHVNDQQLMKEQLGHFQDMALQLQSNNHKLDVTNRQLLNTVTEQNVEMQELRRQQRQAKQDLRTATAKLEEMTKLLQNAQEHMQRRDEDTAEAYRRHEGTERRLQQTQAALSQLEVRLQAATQEVEKARRDQASWERRVSELQARCSSLEEERFEAVGRVRESTQATEEAVLQKQQALLREKQRSEELEKIKEAIKHLIQDAAVRTRKEVDNVRKQCNEQINRMAEELAAAQLECADKQALIERGLRERKAVEDELEKLYREGRAEPEYRKMEALHQRCLTTERLKDELQLTLQTTQNKIKKMELDYEEELSRCQEEVRRLQSTLASAREDCNSVSEERLHLQQENQQLQKEMEELRKDHTKAQRKAKHKVSTMEHEFSLKEQSLEAQLRELEESSRTASADLTRLLTAQQRTSKRWQEEAHKLTDAFEHKLASLKSELVRQKQRCQELELQMETDHDKIVESERLRAECQEKNSRLQSRVSQAEQRAAALTQQVVYIVDTKDIQASLCFNPVFQLSIFTSQRRKATSLLDLDVL